MLSEKHLATMEDNEEKANKREIYIFHPKDHTVEELWQIVQEREQLRRDGAIGDCLMRKIAQREARGTYTVLNMEGIANRASVHLLKHYFPFRFQKKQQQ